jgi:hypothetical protein
LRVESKIIPLNFVEELGAWRLFKGVGPDGNPLCAVIGDDPATKSYRLISSPRLQGGDRLLVLHSGIGIATKQDSMAIIAFPTTKLVELRGPFAVPLTAIDDSVVEMNLADYPNVAIALMLSNRIDITIFGNTTTYSLDNYLNLHTKALECIGADADTPAPSDSSNPFIAGAGATPSTGTANPFIGTPTRSSPAPAGNNDNPFVSGSPSSSRDLSYYENRIPETEADLKAEADLVLSTFFNIDQNTATNMSYARHPVPDGKQSVVSWEKDGIMSGLFVVAQRNPISIQTHMQELVATWNHNCQGTFTSETETPSTTDRSGAILVKTRCRFSPTISHGMFMLFMPRARYGHWLIFGFLAKKD